MADSLDGQLGVLADQVARLLHDRGETVAAAEATAGGLLSAALASGGSVWAGGVVAYSKIVKAAVLDAELEDLPVSAVSSEMAVALARGIRLATNATWGVSETGIAGPQAGRRSSKPAGLVFVAVSGPVERVEKHEAELDLRLSLGAGATGPTPQKLRIANQTACALAALELLATAIGEVPASHTPQPTNVDSEHEEREGA